MRMIESLSEEHEEESEDLDEIPSPVTSEETIELVDRYDDEDVELI